MPHEDWAHDGAGVVGDLEDIDDLAARVAAGAQGLAEELELTRKILHGLLSNAGKPHTCKGPNCGQRVLLIYHAVTGRWTPYNADGTNHFTTCVDRELFHRRRQQRAARNDD